MTRVRFGIVGALALACAALFPSSAIAFTALRPTTEATQNAYGLWYGPAKSCGQEGCHDTFAGKPTVHSNMVTDISAAPGKLVPSPDSGEWPAPSGGGLSLGPSDIFLQIGDNKGFLEYTGFAGSAATNPLGDLPLWSPLEWEFSYNGWLPPTTPTSGKSYSQSCSACHNTGVTRPSNATYTLPNGAQQTTSTPSGVVDFSIGCQVCHGTGENAKMHAQSVPEVVGGVQILKAQVCGQCHVSGATPQKGVTGSAFGNPNGYTTDEDLSAYLTAYTNVPTESQFASYLASGGTKPRFLPNGANYSLRHSYYNEWLLNKAANGFGHADSVNPIVVMYNDPKCLRCHSGLGFLNRIGAKGPGGDPLVPTPLTVAQADAVDVGISCQVCHSGHVGYAADGEYKHERKWSTGKAVECGDCHNWQFEILEQAVQTEVVGGVAHSRPALNNRIRHPQREMLSGGAQGGMWGVEPVEPPMGDTACPDCHMPRTHKEGMPADDHGDEEATRVSHRFHVVEPGDAERWRLRPNGDSCVAECHSGEREEYTRAEFQEWIEEQKTEVADDSASATGLLDSIASDLGLANWYAFMAAQPTGGAASSLTTAEWHMLQKAAQNTDFVVNDASGGIHNPEYAKAGLEKAAVWAESLRPELTLSWPGGFVEGDTATLTATFSGRSGLIDGASLQLQSSTDDGVTWSDRGSMSPTAIEFTVEAAPVVGETLYRLQYEPDAGVAYTSNTVCLTTPETDVALDPSPNDAGWLSSPVNVTLAGPVGSLTFYSLAGATVSAPSAYLAPLSVSAEGVTVLGAWSVDGSGREGVVPLEIRIDKTAPTITSDAKATYAERAVIALTGNDAHSGVARVRYSLDGAAPVTASGATAAVTVASLGSHTLTFAAQDAAGHWSATASKSFSVRSTPKVVKSPTGSVYGLRRGGSWRFSAIIKRPNGTRISGKRVLLQRSTNGRYWSTYATHVTNSSGYVGRDVRQPSAGTYYWRWRVTTDSRYNSSICSATKIVVR